jgi:Rps23 Pro-64 3,4-dihydroxylase Tpa1-like proline 4-hydroxylase
MQVKNNLLTETELKIVSEILSKQAWGFGFISNDVNLPIWNFSKDVGRPVAELIASKFEGLSLQDFHINGQTQSQMTAVHDDASQGATHAVVFFPYFWDYFWGGRLHILAEEATHIITPQRNMAVMFDARTPHFTEAPITKELRVSIGLKLK